MAKFTYASGAILLPNLVQVTESISGSVVPLAMFSQGVFFDSCYAVERNRDDDCDFDLW